MSNYTKSTNFATKDNLTPGDPLKIVRGTEIDTEFNNIATAIATKTDNSAAAITGGSITGITDLAIADGGTGASTATAAINNLLPSQTSNANKYLQTDGTNVSWDAVSLSTSDITGTLPVANGGTGVTSSTGTGSVVLSNSPTLVTPALGTPASGVATNLTGLPISTGVSGLGTGVATFLGTPSSANLASAVSDETGSGALVFANSPTLVTPALGTPSSATLTNATGLPISTGVSGLGTGVATFLATPSSANLRSALTDETGSGSAVFATSPALVTPDLGTPSAATLTNATGLPISTGVSGLGTGVATALAVNVGSAGAPVVNGGALGTPSSGTVTNLTGTASININGTVGATTPTTGAFTTVAASSSVTLSGGTANGVTYLNGSKVLTSGSALTWDGSALKVGGSGVSVLDDQYFYFAGGASYIQGSTASNYIKFGITSAEQMRLTSTGLGIGTSSPSEKLTVAGSVSSSSEFVIKSGTTAKFALGQTSDAFYIYSNAAGTERLRLDSAGNLGLGVTPSAWGGGKKVLQASNASFAGQSDRFEIWANAYYDGSAVKYISNGYATLYQSVNGAHSWQTAASGTAGGTVTLTQAMTLDASGNLGVGTTSPSARLHVSGGASYITGASNGTAQLQFFNNAQTTSGFQVGQGYASNTDNIAYIFNTANAAMVFGTNNTERARIDSSGTFRVKGAGTAGSTDALQISGSAPASAMALDSSGNLRLINSNNIASITQTAITLTGASGSGTGGQTVNVITANSTTRGILIVGSTQNCSAIFFINASQAVNLSSQTTNETRFTATSGAANTANVYVSGSNIVLENNIQATRDFYVTFIGQV